MAASEYSFRIKLGVIAEIRNRDGCDAALRPEALAASTLVQRFNMGQPQRPGQGTRTNSPDASTRHTNTHDARNGGGHNSGDSGPSAPLPSGSSAEILPQLQLNLIEIFSYYRFHLSYGFLIIAAHAISSKAWRMPSVWKGDLWRKACLERDGRRPLLPFSGNSYPNFGKRLSREIEPQTTQNSIRLGIVS
jgi:hypothetical protein